MKLRPALISLLALCAAPASAESFLVNLHLEPGFGIGLDADRFVNGASLKLDTTAFWDGAVVPQVEFFGLGTTSSTYLAQGSAFGGGIGLRLRLFDDQKGYLWNPGGVSGNAWGNLWVDAHFIVAHGGLGAGFNLGAGYEFSLIDGLQVGPFMKFFFIGPNKLLLWGLSFSIGFPAQTPPDADPDGDGIKGAADKCPNQAEDMDGFEDTDGCPEKDNDKDGIEDAKDKCPNDPEDKDGVQDEDGCPETDADNDGVLDANDKCPLAAEDKDGVQDDDGCPETDADADGILDEKDKCPVAAEDKDGIQDDDGCPETDADKDGVLDEKDKCPLEPETINGVDDEDGCPEKDVKVFIQQDHIVITEKIFFAFGKATILPKSNPILDGVATIMKKFPNVKKVSVEGHTDDVGDAKKNQTLSENRAKAVMDAVVARGVEKARLVSKGYGSTKPLATGTTEAAREQNRRVEFVIVEPAAK